MKICIRKKKKVKTVDVTQTPAEKSIWTDQILTNIELIDFIRR